MVMPVMIFTKDHKAETIAHIVSEVKNYRNQHATDNVTFRLATGNVGVMAATNEEVSAAQFPILLYVFGAVTLLCFYEFRSIRAVLCIILPLALVSLLAYALMSINAVRAVELGSGCDVVEQKGSEHRDEISSKGFLSNNSGGTLGGISSGQDIVAHISLKPTSSIRQPGRSVDTEGKDIEVVTTGRHDPCVGIRATPIAEAMLAIVLLDHALRDRGQNSDVERT